jgi:catechol 2,3-dioxygenase-like lactoylglutathione lyase family enzyme
MDHIRLGAFSISLAVKDIHISHTFYTRLGFEKLGGNIDQKWLILKNGNAIIGLFEGMFAGNIITFNPGWDENGQNVDPFDDVRTIQAHLIAHGISLTHEADHNPSGPAHITLTDPDGNNILIDQHR